ncbi:hypothetical protein GCM10009610_18860 [Pseudonocardia xinjiangensis]
MPGCSGAAGTDDRVPAAAGEAPSREDPIVAAVTAVAARRNPLLPMPSTMSARATIGSGEIIG